MEYLLVVIYFFIGFVCGHFIWDEKLADQYEEARANGERESNSYACIILGFFICLWPLPLLAFIIKDAIHLIKTRP